MAAEKTREQTITPILRSSIVAIGLIALLFGTVIAQEIAGNITGDVFAEVLLTAGLVLITLGAVAAVAHIATASKVTTVETTTVDTAVPTVKTAAGLPVISTIVSALKETLTVLASTPSWVAMLVLGGVLVVLASLYDGYDGFGLEVTSADEHGTAVVQTQIAESSPISVTQTAEAMQFERTLQLLDRCILPDGYTVIGTPVACTPIPTP